MKFLDVRIPEAYIFIGHPDMAVNIPLLFPKYEWDDDKRRYGVEPNVDFLTDVQSHFSPDDTILAMCRSGGRASAAATALEGAGYTVMNMTNGFEGPPDDRGYHVLYGWKNDELPYSLSSPALIDGYPD